MTRFTLLLRHFCRGLLRNGDPDIGTDSDSIDPCGALALLAVPGLIIPILLFPKYSPLLNFIRGLPPIDAIKSSLEDEYMLICISMSVAGLIAVLKWDSLFLCELDYRNLSPLPLVPAQVLLAKAAALGLLTLIVFVTVNGPSSLFFPVVVSGAGHVDLLRFLIAHIISVFLATAFGVCLVMAIAGGLLAICSQSAFVRISRYLRAALIVGFLTLLSTAFGVTKWMTDPRFVMRLHYVPTVGIVALWQRILGRKLAPLGSLDGFAVKSVVLLFAFSALTFYIAFRLRYLNTPQSVAAYRDSGRGSSLVRFVLWVARLDEVNSACTAYVLVSLFRSDRHWLEFSAWIGGGVAFCIACFSVQEGTGFDLVFSTGPSVGLFALGFVCLWGLRRLFDIPAAVQANWVFQMSGKLGEGNRDERIAMAMSSTAVVPVAAAVTLLHSVVDGIVAGIVCGVFFGAVMWICAVVLFLNLRKIPFTCASRRTVQNPTEKFMVFVFCFCLVVLIPVKLETWMLRRPFRMYAGIAVTTGVATAVYGLRRKVRRSFGGQLMFHTDPAPVIVTLNLSVAGTISPASPAILSDELLRIDPSMNRVR